MSGGIVSEESACIAGDPGSILGLRRPPGEGHGNPFQYGFNIFTVLRIFFFHYKTFLVEEQVRQFTFKGKQV